MEDCAPRLLQATQKAARPPHRSRASRLPPFRSLLLLAPLADPTPLCRLSKLSHCLELVLWLYPHSRRSSPSSNRSRLKRAASGLGILKCCRFSLGCWEGSDKVRHSSGKYSRVEERWLTSPRDSRQGKRRPPSSPLPLRSTLATRTSPSRLSVITFALASAAWLSRCGSPLGARRPPKADFQLLI